MVTIKVGERSRQEIIKLFCEYMDTLGFDTLQTGSATFAIPIVEDEEEGAIEIVFKIPKGPRDGSGYDPYEAAEAFTFKQNEKAIKKAKQAEDKAKKIAKSQKEKGE